MTKTGNNESIVKGDHEERHSRVLVGRVVSDKADKSVGVQIERLIKHNVYGKYIRRSTKILAHDESNQCKTGDVVKIAECRPVSKRKAWRVMQVLQGNKTR